MIDYLRLPRRFAPRNDKAVDFRFQIDCGEKGGDCRVVPEGLLAMTVGGRKPAVKPQAKFCWGVRGLSGR